MATIKEVAKEAGVSVATVSRVLNKSGYVSKESAASVKKAIEKLNYQPNSVARSLYHKTSNMIGLIIPDITNPFFPELARAVEDVAMIYGYTVVLCNSDQDPDKEKKYIDLFKQKYVDGIIITAHGSNSELYIDSKIPIVALDRISDSSLPTVVSNNYDGARNATKLLLQKGAKNLAHIRGPQGITPADDRYQGFIDEMKEQHFDYIIEESAFELKAAEKLAENFFNTHAQVDGIFCSSDAIAVGFLKVALKRGIKIPQDVQIIGFDGVAFGEMIYPELTTVAQPIYDMGALATRLLIKIINGKETEQLKYEIPTKMIERGTTK
ncbi:LacI family DNA-binding transcriptional regulator [Oceanobacillus sp. FSL K6-2867]|uniref:LacI family DNA-binding transcriptional regulator n=1 Tax=Oceanobacillus sp. FSL K6-2867 TaxID=2954748 RepID=UPI0030DC98C0